MFATGGIFLLEQRSDNTIILLVARVAEGGNGRLVPKDAERQKSSVVLPAVDLEQFLLLLCHFMPGDLPDDGLEPIQFLFEGRQDNRITYFFPFFNFFLLGCL